MSGETEYMEKNQLHDFFRILKQCIEEEQPENPVDFIAEFISKVSKPRLVIKGPPASGKGTQCERLVRNLGAVHISTGDILRDEIKRGTDLGKEASTYMKDGHLVPDELVVRLVKERLSQEDVAEKGWILDGFPRTAAQARIMREEGILPDCVIKLEVGDEEIIRRVEGRRIDPATNKVYHVHSYPPPQGLTVVQRPDDTRDAIVKRLDTYHSSLQQVLEMYSCPVHPIEGKDADDVGLQIMMVYQRQRWHKQANNVRSML